MLWVIPGVSVCGWMASFLGLIARTGHCIWITSPMRLHLAVADTGIGMRAEDMNRIFIEFSQVDASHSRRHEGTGLGLALSKRLVEAHGGHIWVDSTSGVGSTLHVILPLWPDESGKSGESRIVNQNFVNPNSAYFQ